jgi:hypothetical protein
MLRQLLALRSLNVRTVDRAVRWMQITRWLASGLGHVAEGANPRAIAFCS